MTTDLHPFANLGRTKLSLVSRGLALPQGLSQPSRWISQVNAVEAVVDIRLPGGHFATVPVGQPYTEESTFELTESAEGFVLSCAGESERVEVVESPQFYKATTRSGARMGSFSSLHDRLLMLYPTMGCGFFAKPGSACQYCQYDSMLNEDTPPLRDPLELVEVVRAALAEREVDTVYIYNGYAPGDDAGLRRLVPVIALLRKHLGHRQIALETVAPLDVHVIDELYAAGLDIFVCNLEVHDKRRFAEICPGKAAHGGQDAVCKALDHAAKLFPPGAVVSHLIVGMESLPSTITGMEKLVEHGVVPLLLPFRPLPGTPLESTPLPSLDDVEEALLVQYRLLAKSGLPTNRLRDMGRVLTPMEGRTLVGEASQLQERLAVSSIGRRLLGWKDMLSRQLWNSARTEQSEREEHAPRRNLQSMFLRWSGVYAALAISAVIAFLAMSQSPPDGLTTEGWRALVVFVLCLVLWVTQLLPLTVTSLLGLALLPLAGVLPAADAYGMFGNSAVFFILGAFMLAAGAIKTGLSEHLALAILDRVGHGPRRLLIAMLLLPAFMACFMPEHAVAAVMLPITWEIVRGLGLKGGNRYAQALFFAVAWGAIVGGVTTLLGGARGPLALGLVEEMTGQSFSFLDWTLAALPIVVPMLGIAALVLLWMTPFGGINVEAALERIEQRKLEVGVLGAAGRVMALLLTVTVGAWIVAGHTQGLAAIALVSVVLMFALRLVSWSDVESHVHWGVVLMYGGAIALGKALLVTGAGSWLAQHLMGDLSGGLLLLVILGLATLVLTECVSNAAAVAIMLPVALPVAIAAGMDPVLTAMAVGIVAGFAFILPMGTPPNAMIYATGHVQPSAMLRYGAVLSLSALMLFVLAAWLWWPAVSQS